MPWIICWTQGPLDYLLDTGYLGPLAASSEDVQSGENSEIKSSKPRPLRPDVGGQPSKFGGVELTKKKFFEIVLSQAKGVSTRMDDLELIS